VTGLATARLTLSPWDERHRAPFAAMHADPEVMADLGGPIDAAAAGAKLDRYAASLRDHGVSRWAVEGLDGCFLGYAGVNWRGDARHPLGAHFEIGWRLVRAAWGRGYATEAAQAVLDWACQNVPGQVVLARVRPGNLASQGVARKIGLRREPFFDDQGRDGLDWAFTNR